MRDVALREKMELYGLKGKLGNCGGYGQCSTCTVSIEGGDSNSNGVSPLTEVEKMRLKGRPVNWRLACQTMVNSNVVVLTRPQTPPNNLNKLINSSGNLNTSS